MRRRAAAVLVFPASAAALVGWFWILTATPSRSVLRYILYWSTILYVPVVVAIVPYRVVARTRGRQSATLVVLGWFFLLLVLVIWAFVRALDTLTF